MKGKSALLLGAYGQTNLGDDLLLYNYVHLLKSKGFDKLYINASEARFVPQVILDQFPDLEVFETYNTSFVELLKLMRKVDAIVYGGGTVYKELYATTGRSRYSVISRVMVFNWLGRLIGKQIYHLHIGIGSIKTRTGKTITKLSLLPTAQTVFRDQQSYDFARQKLGLGERKIQKSTDGLFLNPIWQKAWQTGATARPEGKYKATIGINMLHDVPDWIDRKQYIATMRQFIKKLIKAGNHVVLIPFQHDFNPQNDRVFMKEHFGDIKDITILSILPIDQVSSYFQQLDFFIGMRFHSLLLATVNQRPFVAISYDTKCTRFLEEAAYPYVVLLEDLTLEGLNQTYEQVVHNSKAIRNQLAEIAKTNFETAGAWLQQLAL